MVNLTKVRGIKSNLKAVNLHAKIDEDTRTPEDLMALIEAKGREVAEALVALRNIGTRST